MIDTENRMVELVDRALLGPALPVWSYTRAYFHWKKFRNVRALFKNAIRKMSGPVKVLDVGCGFGQYVFALDREFGKERKLEFQGVDIDPVNLYCCGLKKDKYKADNVSFGLGNAESLAFADGSFDIIISTELLEHLKEPGRALAEFYRVLKPDGTAIITTPNDSNMVVRLKNMFGRIFRRKTSDRMNEADSEASKAEYRKVGFGHISVKGLREWIRILSDSGFKTEHIKRGSLLLGTPRQDVKRVIAGLFILAEVILDRLPFLRNLSEDVILGARKRNQP
ncbi:MAG: class I SAM-dependent methyltransferase [Candidatus Omnitrophica bacterium]|jgi:ubiquinone/menaquinone biosynthesis C-methylase UbiE|nr:class I SAM-dependent methyltransferase [Candidatus Omnitrophota bacterium]MDD5080168.1 class I SAM-dependent methyltransferase [Candidatus Omnitrophota bacterium]